MLQIKGQRRFTSVYLIELVPDLEVELDLTTNKLIKCLTF